jgi:hypothetical protein
MKKTVSEKIAGLFAVVGFMLLIPSALSMIFPAMFLIVSVTQPNVYAFLFGLIPLLLFGSGVVLLVKYYKHSRGLLDEDKILPMWFGSLAYNLMFLLPTAYFCIKTAGENDDRQSPDNTGLLICGLIVTWWITAVLLSVAAIISELKTNQKYL